MNNWIIAVAIILAAPSFSDVAKQLGRIADALLDVAAAVRSKKP